MDKNTVLISAVIVFKGQKNGNRWFIAKQSEEDEWVIPKVLVRKTESSVRAAIRMMGERGGMTIKVLEEAGRAGGVTTVNGKTLPQRHIYYVAVMEDASGEEIGFDDSAWLDYAKAVRKLSSKRERAMIKEARKLAAQWIKERKSKKEEE